MGCTLYRPPPAARRLHTMGRGELPPVRSRVRAWVCTASPPAAEHLTPTHRGMGGASTRVRPPAHHWPAAATCSCSHAAGSDPVRAGSGGGRGGGAANGAPRRGGWWGGERGCVAGGDGTMVAIACSQEGRCRGGGTQVQPDSAAAGAPPSSLLRGLTREWEAQGGNDGYPVLPARVLGGVRIAAVSRPLPGANDVHPAQKLVIVLTGMHPGWRRTRRRYHVT